MVYQISQQQTDARLFLQSLIPSVGPYNFTGIKLHEQKWAIKSTNVSDIKVVCF